MIDALVKKIKTIVSKLSKQIEKPELENGYLPNKFPLPSFQGAVLNVTALPFNPFWDENILTDGTRQYSGSDYRTVAAIGNALNFSIYAIPTSSWAEVCRMRHFSVFFIMSPKAAFK